MKRRMIWIFLAGALVGIVLSGLYKHFVTDQIMDRGGMENPDQNLFLLDGEAELCFIQPLDGGALKPIDPEAAP